MKTRKYTVSLYQVLLQFQSDSSIRPTCDKPTFYKFAGFIYFYSGDKQTIVYIGFYCAFPPNIRTNSVCTFFNLHKVAKWELRLEKMTKKTTSWPPSWYSIIYFIVTFYVFSMDRLLLEFNCKETFFFRKCISSDTNKYIICEFKKNNDSFF